MKILTTVLELLALALIVTGVALIWIPAAFIAAGVGLGAIAWAITSSSKGPAK